LITNSNFEDGLAGWNTSQGQAVYVVDSTIVHSGCCSVKRNETNAASFGRLYQDVSGIASPGQQYQIGGWIRTNNLTGQAVIALDYVGTGGISPSDGHAQEIGKVTGTQDWTYFQSDAFTLPSMPADAQALWFLFDFNGTGTAWWADVSLVCVFCPAPPAPVITSVTGVSIQTNAQIVIQGSGFGTTPPQLSHHTDGSVNTVESARTPSIDISDFCQGICAGTDSKGWEAGHTGLFDTSPGVPWCAELYCGNAIGVFLSSWSDNRIVINGFSALLGPGTYAGGVCSGSTIYTICPGDNMKIRIWGPNYGPVTSFSFLVPNPPNGLQAIPGTFLSQSVSGDNWNSSNPNICAQSTNASQCEASEVVLSGTPGLHLLGSKGSVLPFVGRAEDFGVTLATCQPAFGSVSIVKSGLGVVASCFDQALVVSGKVSGNVNLTVKVELPVEVAGPSCNLVSAQVFAISKHKLVSLGKLLPPTAFETSGSSVICTTTITEDASFIATSAKNAAPKTPFAVVIHEPTTIMCKVSPTVVGSVALCRATVSGNSPTGTVEWFVSGSGHFSPSTCSLSSQGFCQVEYGPTSAASPVPLTASYSGDSRNARSSGIFPLAVKTKVTKTSVSCKPSSLSAASGALFTCTAVVKGYVPTGVVSWTQSGRGTVRFTSDSCTLITGQCSVTVAPGSAGAVKVTATYSGDQNNQGSIHVVRVSVTG